MGAITRESKGPIMVVGLDSLIRDMISNQARLPGVAGLSEGIDGIDGIDGTPTDGIDPI